MSQPDRPTAPSAPPLSRALLEELALAREIAAFRRELRRIDVEADQAAAEDEARAAAERARQQARRQADAAQEYRRAQRKARIERRRVEAERHRADTLGEQIARWWAAQIVTTRIRPYTFSEIRAQLHGVTVGKLPGIEELSAALTRAGWRRVRIWSELEFGRRRWLPPGAIVPSDVRRSKLPTPVKRPRGRPHKFDDVSLPCAEDYS
ncbi:hypothetical protein Tamer19_33990 [Cupriavidus sp. TA19]|uniref:hypothetical protein n=1 Tax=Cupriavidus sp. TA19 TaxID=701108 RepID=UPI002729461E|nr:hypothetical protein [Cupriavidus sp. TA19]GLC93991.1 hypothetical protein Tamer19_33990 [Cupriavidus sp. TA19]